MVTLIDVDVISEMIVYAWSSSSRPTRAFCSHATYFTRVLRSYYALIV